ncbi:MAG: hypothetical protein IT290_00940 [Deltaproteobacteria bacterium]|nr:hypothetical protein [Deltaproteobacteria bacterium]
MKPIVISSFYAFAPIGSEGADRLVQDIRVRCEEHHVLGLFIVAGEGCNATFSGSESGVSALEEMFRDRLSREILFKRSSNDTAPFRKLVIRVRDEIVTSGCPEIPIASGAQALSPAEWHAKLEQGGVTVLDTRNDYEVEIGKFEGATDLAIENFSQFAKAAKGQHFNSSEPILMYCTGGVRCEKALPILEGLGFNNVFQLEGGILNYLEQFPDGYYEGECFVFDDRVAVDRYLQPTTRWALCPLCGNPANEPVPCGVCGQAAKVCADCRAGGTQFCSLGCRGAARRQESGG